MRAQAPSHADGVARPRVLVTNGCAGSTYVMGVARRLLAAHGLRPHGGEYELLNPTKNRHYNRSLAHHGGTAAGIARALAATHDEATRQGASLVFIAAPGFLSEPVAGVLRAARALFVNAWRRNVLDVLVCEVRDCFAISTPTGRRVAARGDATVGFAVDAASGERSHACFAERRGRARAAGQEAGKGRSSSSGGGGGGGAAGGATKAWLNVSSIPALRARLPLHAGATVAALLRARGLARAASSAGGEPAAARGAGAPAARPAAAGGAAGGAVGTAAAEAVGGTAGGLVTLTTEELTRFTLGAESEAAAAAQLARSVAAWRAALGAWGVPARAERVAPLLEAERRRLGAPRTLAPHAATIHNLREVDEALSAAGPAYARLLRREG